MSNPGFAVQFLSSSFQKLTVILIKKSTYISMQTKILSKDITLTQPIYFLSSYCPIRQLQIKFAISILRIQLLIKFYRRFNYHDDSRAFSDQSCLMNFVSSVNTLSKELNEDNREFASLSRKLAQQKTCLEVKRPVTIIYFLFALANIKKIGDKNLITISR